MKLEVQSWWKSCTQHQEALLKPVIYRLDGKSNNQRKYLNFSLFLAGLLQSTHEQIAFVFAGVGEAIETELGRS